MKKKYVIPDASQQKSDANRMVGINVMALVTLFVCSKVFPIDNIAIPLLFAITGLWSTVAIRSFIKPLSVPEAPIDPFADISDSKRLDLIYVLRNIDIFDQAVDPRYPAFVRKYLKDMTPKKANAIPTLLSQLEPGYKPEEDLPVYRNMVYVYSISAIVIGTICTATSIMFMIAGINALLTLVFGIVFLGGSLGYWVFIKKNDISKFFLLFGSAAMLAIIAGLLIK